MISNLIFINVEYDIGQLTKHFSRLYSNEDSFDFTIFVFDEFINGGMCL